MLILWVVIILLALAVTISSGMWIPAIVGGFLLFAFLAWILISTLSPAVPCRICPGCGEEGLVKIRRGAPGVRCEKCEFVDEDLHVAYLDEW